MKISKLIEKLENMKKVHGDIEVRKDVQIRDSYSRTCVSWVVSTYEKDVTGDPPHEDVPIVILQ